MEEIDKKLVKGFIKLEVMKVLWSGSSSTDNIRKQLMERLEIGLDSETLTRILDLMEKNGYVRSKVNRIELRKKYALTSEGKFLFEQTWRSLNFLNTLSSNHEKLVKWISLHLASRNIWVSEQMIENSLRNYQAEEKLREHLTRT